MLRDDRGLKIRDQEKKDDEENERIKIIKRKP